MKCDLLVINEFLGTGVDSYFSIALSFCKDFSNCLRSPSVSIFLFGVMFSLFDDRSTLTLIPLILDSAWYPALELMKAFYLLFPIAM
jgi:hypothetical protein